MHALFARLRAISFTAPPVPVVPPEPDPPSSQSIPQYTLPISRHIHPDPNALLATYTAELDERARNEPDRGLRPSSRRPSVDGPIIRRSEAHIPTSEAGIDEVSEPAPSREPSQTTVPASIDDTTSPSHWLIHSFTHFASPSVWSTFGRGRQHSSSPIDPFSRTDSRPGSSNKSLQGTPDQADGQPPSRKSSTKPRSSFSHDSPGSESIRSSTMTTTTPVRSRPESTRTQVATHDSPLERSPRTFGHPTPEMPSTPLIGRGSPPPPLPPLVHHGLRTIPSQDGDEDLRAEEIKAVHEIPLTIEHDTSALYPNPPKDQITYPRRSRIRNDPFALSSLSAVNSRSRSKSSPAPTRVLPMVQQIFPNADEQHSSITAFPTMPTITQDVQVQPPAVGDTPSKSVLPRPLSSSGRRSSAEWSAEQAVAVEANTWPAQVSRQILELSFGGTTGDPKETFPQSPGSEARVAARAPFDPSLSSPPLVSPSSPLPSLSSSLGPPFLLQGAL